MANNYLKELKLHKIFLFLLCGIVIVLFLNYNNLNLYKKKISSKIENFDTIQSILDFKPIENIIVNEIIDIDTDTKKSITIRQGQFNYDNLYKFIRVICPSEILSSSTTTAIYNKLNCRSIDVVNNKNNALFTEIFTINTNKLESINNVFASRLLDTRADKNLPYASNDKLIEIPLKFEHGININIDFILQFSYNINPSNIPSKIKISEILPSKFLIESQKSKYKTYDLESFKLEMNTNDNNNYLMIFTLPDVNSNNKTLNQELVLDLKFNNFTTNSTTYEALLGDVNIFKSVMTYNIYYKDNKVFSTNVKVIFNTTDISGNLKDYTENEIKSIFTETLNDKYNKIVTPLFLMDNEISKKEKMINDIKSHYLLNELSNIQSNIKFFNNFS
jgi:hypothetical protein